MFRRFCCLSVLFIVVFMSSCGGFEDDPIVPTSEETFGIRHDRSLTDYTSIATGVVPGGPDLESVVAFSYSLDGSANQEFVATGTLVHPEWILTAGHNFFVADEQSSPAPVSGIEVLTGSDPNDPEARFSVAELVFFPTWTTQDDGFSSANDLCLVRLQSPITNVTPAPMFVTTEEGLGTTVWGAGYGDLSGLAGEDPEAFSQRRAFQNVLDRKVAGLESSVGGQRFPGGLLAFDFDHPGGLVNSLGDNRQSSDEPLLGGGNSSATALNLEGSTVEGDSGGPLFVLDADGIWKVAGVLSGGAEEPIVDHRDGSYGDISVYMRVATASAWITSVIE